MAAEVEIEEYHNYMDNEMTPCFYSDIVEELRTEFEDKLDPDVIKDGLLKEGIIGEAVVKLLNQEKERRQRVQIIVTEVLSYLKLNRSRGFLKFLKVLYSSDYVDLVEQLQRRERKEENSYASIQISEYKLEKRDKQRQIETFTPVDLFDQISSDINALCEKIKTLEMVRDGLSDKVSLYRSTSKQKKSLEELVTFPAYPRFPRLDFRGVYNNDIDSLQKKFTKCEHIIVDTLIARDKWLDTMTDWFSEDFYTSRDDLKFVVEKWLEMIETCIQDDWGKTDWEITRLDPYTQIQALGCGDDVIKSLTSKM